MADKTSHFWMIPSWAAEAAFASMPSVLRLSSTPRDIAARVAQGVCSAFSILNPSAERGHLWFDSYTKDNEIALGFINTSTHREKGWGPAKTLGFVNDQIMAAFPDALPFLHESSIKPRSLSANELSSVLKGLVERASALDEARQIATAAPTSLAASRVARI